MREPGGTAPSGEAGFTLVEIIIALVFLTVVAVGMVGTARYSGEMLERSRAELGAAEFLSHQMDRLLTLPYDSLRSGSGSSGGGTAQWEVEDSVTYRKIFLRARYRSPRGILLADSVVAYRIR